MKIKNEKGEEIEVFTSEDVEARAREAADKAKAEAIDEYKKANPDQTGELDSLRSELAKKEADLQAALDASSGNESEQVKRLRAERDKAQLAADKAVADLGSKVDTFIQGQINEFKTELLDKLSGNDPDLKKKIEFEFDRYRPNDNSKQAITERMQKAYSLATDKPAPGVLDGISGGDRGNSNPGGEVKKEYNANEKAIGNALGITEEDRVNYEKFKANQK